MSSYLSELCNFYERMIKADAPDMPPAGMTIENISFVLVIGEDGQLLRIEDLRDSAGSPMRIAVPAPVTRSGQKISANFLWDNTGYALGVDGGNKKSADKFAAFRELHEQLLAGIDSLEARALLDFLKDWQPEKFSGWDLKDEMAGKNVVFKMDGSDQFLHEKNDFIKIWANTPGRYDGSGPGVCLATGRTGLIVPTHPKIKGVAGAQSSGAALISFNADAFESYGKKQNANAPVSESAAHDYVAALNYLLDKKHGQAARAGDMSIVFWADRPIPEEKEIASLFNFSPVKDAPQDTDQVERIKGLLEAWRKGNRPNGIDALARGAQFHVLGLAPNASRLAVRFWLRSTLEELLGHINQWYEDLELEQQNQARDPQFPPLWFLLRALAPQKKKENRPKGPGDGDKSSAQNESVQNRSEDIPKELAGQLARCIITGSRFPESVYAALLQRIHADKCVDYSRAALIKAYLCRNHSGDKSMKILNKDEKNIGYRLGRVFALLEKAQKVALGKDINAPIGERYIGSASATPCQVFPILLRRAQHHLGKIRKEKGEGPGTIFAIRMAEILEDVTDFPATLSLADQGRFMLGYYHQRNAFYTKKADSAETKIEEESRE